MIGVINDIKTKPKLLLSAETNKRYKVISDEGSFKVGDIIIALTDGLFPFCIQEEKYIKQHDMWIHYSEVEVICSYCLQEIE
jgi:hypothetical protein